jgi:AhpD family alkylhydroperoxidase
VAEIHGAGYCLSAHVHAARSRTGLDDAEITANRNGASNDPKADAAVRFALRLLLTRGAVSDAELAQFKAAGYGDGEAIEIAVLVALNTLTNTVTRLAETDIDFPPVALRRAA